MYVVLKNAVCNKYKDTGLLKNLIVIVGNV
jgi:hypothetical protein